MVACSWVVFCGRLLPIHLLLMHLESTSSTCGGDQGGGFGGWKGGQHGLAIAESALQIAVGLILCIKCLCHSHDQNDPP